MIETIELKVDPEFRDKIPPLRPEEFSGLREDILRDGYVRDPLVVWQEEDIILDGHHRWKIIQENIEILQDKFSIDYKSFPDRWSAIEWICNNQLHKHNLTDEQRTVLIGKMYEARKQSKGGDRRSAEFSKDQNELLKSEPNKTARKIADEIGVGVATVKRAEKFSKGIDALKEESPEAAEKVLQGGSGVTKAIVMGLPMMEPEERKEVAEAILNGKSVKSKPVGWTKEDRKNRAEIEAIVADLYDPSTVPEFTIDDLIDDIRMNAENYIRMLRNTLTDRSTLLTPENKPKVADAIDLYLLEEIKKVRNLVK